MDLETVILISGIISILSIFVGYNLIKGGKKMENDNIVYAGVFWLIITLISIILTLKAGYDARPANTVETVENEATVEATVISYD